MEEKKKSFLGNKTKRNWCSNPNKMTAEQEAKLLLAQVHWRETASRRAVWANKIGTSTNWWRLALHIQRL